MHFEMGAYFLIVMLVAFAFESWYMAFGIVSLKDYFRKEMKEEFHISQWCLICPFVAYTVLSTFVYNLLILHIIFSTFILLLMIFIAILFFYLAYRHYKCS